jgi:hypothetical protein
MRPDQLRLRPHYSNQIAKITIIDSKGFIKCLNPCDSENCNQALQKVEFPFKKEDNNEDAARQAKPRVFMPR